MKIEYALCGDSVAFAEQEAASKQPSKQQRRYHCSECRERLVLRRTTPKTKGGRYNVSAFFAHERTASSCPGPSGESLQHLRCKHALVQFVGHYDFCLERCCECDDSLGFMTSPGDRVELERRVTLDGSLFVFDALISRRGRMAVAVEVFHTHKTEQRKIDASRAHGIQIVEVRAETVLLATPALECARAEGRSVTLENLLAKTHYCIACASLGVYTETTLDAWDAWQDVVLTQQAVHATEMALVVLALVDELRKLAEARRLRGLKRKAFLRAQAYAEEFEETRARKAPAVFCRGVSFKCCACGAWETDGCRISRFKFTTREFEMVHEWRAQRGLPLPDFAQTCRLCSITCLGCGDAQLLDHACKYGLCFECNLKSTSIP